METKTVNCSLCNAANAKTNTKCWRCGNTIPRHINSLGSVFDNLGIVSTQYPLFAAAKVNHK